MIIITTVSNFIGFASRNRKHPLILLKGKGLWKAEHIINHFKEIFTAASIREIIGGTKAARVSFLCLQAKLVYFPDLAIILPLF